ncbi:MAG: magnesium transporter [Chloroflexi bacterium]|nr:magnesium transporter [Chloroflexota bacterium]
MPPVQDLDLILDQVRSLLAHGQVEEAAATISALRPAEAADVVAALHPADGADVLEELEPQERADVVEELDPEIGAEVLIELDEDERTDVANRLDVESLSEFLDEMAPDDAADVLGDLSASKAKAALDGMDQPDEVRGLLEHDEESAGGLMIPHVVAFRQSMTVHQTIEFLRRAKPDEETSYYLFVTDDADRLIGVVSLRQLIVADPLTPLHEIMSEDVFAAEVGTDQEECARLLARYDLLALPIVDDDRKLVGVVTADDLIDVIEEEATEDIYHLANLDADEDVYDNIFRSSRRRLTWLFINLPTAVLAGWVVSRFTGTIQLVPILAAFVPIIAGQGGNAGIQTLTLIVRSLALGEITLRDSWRTLSREMAIGLVNGLIFGLCVGLLGMFWQGSPMIGVVVGGAMMLNLVGAAISGTVVPLGLRFLKVDPALASGVIVTTVTDVTGNFVLLALATLLLLTNT